ncbi:MAG: Rpn family recombination-promoting nuclease/putative transposase [Calothrix sp. MO_192.B10]|nr:Rpn family recombination-promoting nuclease/putative transposase [Calothrix sp. MO_192.B10]
MRTWKDRLLRNNWRGVVVYPNRSTDIGETERYIELLTSQRVQCIYLDELDAQSQQSIGIETVKLVIEPEATTGTRAKELIELARQQVDNEVTQKEILELIETIIVYKFPQKSREEIEQMLGLTELKQTKVYQEAKLEGKIEGKIETIPFMLSLGATVEQIAEALDLDIKLVQQVVQTSQSTPETRSESGQSS